jgi:hypothetical protein
VSSGPPVVAGIHCRGLECEAGRTSNVRPRLFPLSGKEASQAARQHPKHRVCGRGVREPPKKELPISRRAEEPYSTYGDRLPPITLQPALLCGNIRMGALRLTHHIEGVNCQSRIIRIRAAAEAQMLGEFAHILIVIGID